VSADDFACDSHGVHAAKGEPLEVREGVDAIIRGAQMIREAAERSAVEEERDWPPTFWAWVKAIQACRREGHLFEGRFTCQRCARRRTKR
jgi:hypothetical protein